MRFSVSICTYKRPQLLKSLLLDISKQSVAPFRVIIVDGDPASGEVVNMLSGMQGILPWLTKYIPSNHSNAPYQRYLGARHANSEKVLIFLDDDIRLNLNNIFEKVLDPFIWTGRNVVGVSPIITFPARAFSFSNNKDTLFSKILRESHKKNPGGVTPIGNRIIPEASGELYDTVKWLRGGMMAYRYDILSAVIYSEDAFAMSHIGCGSGVDDSYLAWCAGIYGELLIANCVEVEHPDLDTSKVIPQDAMIQGNAAAYSRRFLNDHYRVTQPPTFTDRLALGRSYLVNNLLNLLKALTRPRYHRFAYAWGYFLGSMRGLLQKPTARNLTPEIDWQKDADDALAQAVTIH